VKLKPLVIFLTEFPDQIQDNFIMKKLKFICPNHGPLDQEEVDFLCNRCPQKDLIHWRGAYFCPSCFVDQKAFLCRYCGSKEVVMEPGGTSPALTS
jgi:hypothetical protein